MEVVPGRVMIFGTFDFFHEGHKDFIRQARAEGEELIIVVARDNMVYRFKDVLVHDEQSRMKAVQEAYPEVRVILGDKEYPMANIQKFRPEKICLGYDQIGFLDDLLETYPEIEIKRMKPYKPEQYKSSLLRKAAEENKNDR